MIVKTLFIFCLSSMVIPAFALSLCEGGDERIHSEEAQVGLLRGPKGQLCTVTLIGKSCAITAGHCFGLNEAWFNIRPTIRKGLFSSSRDIYSVRSWIGTRNLGPGADFAVVKFRRNSHTKKFPGEVQGHLPVHMSYEPSVGEFITISGHGVQRTKSESRNVQKQDSGPVVKVNRNILSYRVDTTKGDSGAAILNGRGEIIGIHTHGGCHKDKGSNHGSLISEIPLLRKAIKACIEWEQKQGL